MGTSSQPFVNFISSLSPLYQQQVINCRRCAKRLRDGTILVPQDWADESPSQGQVTVWWHGDPQRCSSIHGGILASSAITDFLEFQLAYKGEDDMSFVLSQLTKHLGQPDYRTQEAHDCFSTYTRKEDESDALGNFAGWLTWDVLRRRLRL